MNLSMCIVYVINNFHIYIFLYLTCITTFSIYLFKNKIATNMMMMKKKEQNLAMGGLTLLTQPKLIAFNLTFLLSLENRTHQALYNFRKL